MAYEFKLPDLGEGLTEGEIVKWLVKVGDPIEEGQTFVQVETDKAVIEIPSPRKGVVLQIPVEEGATVEVGQVILVIGEAGEKVESVVEPTEVEKPASVGVVGQLEEAPEEVVTRKAGVPGVAGEPEKAHQEVREKTVKEVPKGPVESLEVLATPAVRKLARELKVDLKTVKGSGPHGRITKEDIQRPAEKAEAKPPGVEIKAARKYDIQGNAEDHCSGHGKIEIHGCPCHDNG
jgi:pyruvate dehydrogenase E2 component (dihydrolipoamide acetyltransferase)